MKCSRGMLQIDTPSSPLIVNGLAFDSFLGPEIVCIPMSFANPKSVQYRRRLVGFELCVNALAAKLRENLPDFFASKFTCSKGLWMDTD